MKTYNHNKVSDFGTTKIDKGMHYYIPMDVILVDIKECSYQNTTEELEQKQQVKEDLAGITFLMKFCEDQNWLIIEQDKQMKELLKQLTDYEEEIYEKDLQIQQFETEIQSHISDMKYSEKSYRREDQ